MNRSTATIVTVALALAGAPLAAQTSSLDQASNRTSNDAQLAAESLSDGESLRAIAQLRAALGQQPGDPALLINLGIAYAQAGSDGEALESFEAALASREIVELETADGRATDSRRLARRAIAMLERGEFRAEDQTSQQLSLRD